MNCSNGRADRTRGSSRTTTTATSAISSQPLPCLHALDPDGRVIYVGTFSKTLFPRAATRIPDRAARPAVGLHHGASRDRPASAGARANGARDVHQPWSLRAARAPHAGRVRGTSRCAAPRHRSLGCAAAPASGACRHARGRRRGRGQRRAGARGSRGRASKQCRCQPTTSAPANAPMRCCSASVPCRRLPFARVSRNSRAPSRR